MTEGEFSRYLGRVFTQPSNQVRPPLDPPLRIGPIGGVEEEEEFPGHPVTTQRCTPGGCVRTRAQRARELPNS